MSIIDLTGEQGGFVNECMTGMKLLSGPDAKVSYLIEVARAGKSKLNKHGFRAVLERVAETDFGESVGDLSRMLRQSLGRGFANSYSDEANLFAAMCWYLEDVIAEDKELNPTVLSLWFTEVIYFAVVLLRTSEYSGTACKLLGVFGENCPEELLDKLAVDLEQDENSYSRDILNALADGNNKLEGSWEVRKVYRSTKLNNISEDRAKAISAAQAEARVVFAHRVTDVASNSTIKDTIITILSHLMGAEEAKKWLTDEFEDLVPQPSG